MYVAYVRVRAWVHACVHKYIHVYLLIIRDGRIYRWMCIHCLSVYVHVCMYVCMDVWMYVCMYGCMDVWMYGCMDGCMYVWMYGCMYRWMNGRMDGRMDGRTDGWNWWGGKLHQSIFIIFSAALCFSQIVATKACSLSSMNKRGPRHL